MVDIFMEDVSFGGAGSDDYSGLHISDTALDTDLQAAFEVPEYPVTEGVEITSGPKQEDWDRLRPVICTLYLDANMNLMDVAAIMRQEHNHKASENMYKKRFQKWGIEKNRKSKELPHRHSTREQRTAVRKALPLQLREQHSADQIMGPWKEKNDLRSFEYVANRDTFPNVNIASNVPYCARIEDNSAFPENPAQENAIASQFSNIRSLSTRKSAITRRKISHATSRSIVSRRQLLIPSNNVRSRSPLGEVPPPVAPPKALLIPEMLLSATKVFMQGSFDRYKTDEMGPLVPHESQNATKTDKAAIFESRTICFAALSFLSLNLFVEARQLLSKACEKSQDVIAEGHPRTLPIIFEIHLYFSLGGFGEAVARIMKNLVWNANRTPKTSCAFRQLLQNLLLLNHNAEDAYFAAWKCCDDIYEQCLEPFHKSWLYCRLDYIEALGFLGDEEKAERLSRSLSIECEQLCGKLDSRFWETRCTLAWSLYDQNKFNDAENLAEDTLQCIQLTEDETRYGYGTIRILAILSQCQYEQKKYNLAEENIRQCIHLNVKINGEDDADTIAYLLRLETWLNKWGRHEEAMELAAKRSQILGSPIIEELL